VGGRAPVSGLGVVALLPTSQNQDTHKNNIFKLPFVILHASPNNMRVIK
jgi:hypothetical protein